MSSEPSPDAAPPVSPAPDAGPRADARPAAPAWRAEAIAMASVAALAALVCLALVGLDPHFFWHDDCQIAAVPVWFDMYRAFSHGEWPLLTPYSWNMPAFAGEFQAGVFSPLILPGLLGACALGLTMPATAAVYGSYLCVVTALGAFRVARSEAVPVAAAALVAIVGTFNGWNMAWAATNWIPAMSGNAAMVWTWWAMIEAVRPGAPIWRTGVLAIAVYVLLTAGWPHCVFMAGLLTLFVGARACVQTRAPWPFLWLGAGWALGLGLSAPAWLLFLEYLRGTFRPAVGTTLQWEWLVPLQALPGLGLPSGVTTWATFNQYRPHVGLELANGLVATGVLLAALAGPAGRRKALAWDLALVGIVLVLCVAPSIGMFRWSFRWLPLLHLAMGLLAAKWLVRAWAAPPPDWRPSRWEVGAWWENPGAWAFAAALVGQLAAFWVPVISWLLGLGYLAIAAAWAIAEDRLPGSDLRRQLAPVAVASALLVLTYAMVPNALAVPLWKLTEHVRQPEPLTRGVRYLSLTMNRDYFGEGTESADWGTFVRPGNTALLAGVELVNGYSPLSPRGTSLGFLFGTHGYMEPRGVERALRTGVQPGGMLQRMGVDGLIVGNVVRPNVPGLVARGWHVVAQGREGVVLRRNGQPSPPVRAFPAARVASQDDPVAWWTATDQTDGVPTLPADEAHAAGGTVRFGPRAVTLLASTRHASEVEVGPGAEPALVTVMRRWSPGWEARIGDRLLPVVAVDGLMPGVEVPAGVSGRLTLRYHPRGLVIGAWIALASGVIGLALGYLLRRTRVPGPPTAAEPGGA